MTSLIVDPPLTRETLIYRYVSFETFVSFVETRRICLRKVTDWDDPWEAILLRAPTYDERGMRQVPIYSFYQDTFGQSWTLLAESDAMWRIYSPVKTGLVISTRVRQFELVQGVSRMYVGPVVYFRDLKDLVAKADRTSHSFEALCLKRCAFEHEREVRILTNAQFVLERDPQAKVLMLPVSPVDFVDHVVVDPRAPKWFVDAIASYCRRAGFSCLPVQSDLYAPDPHEGSGLKTMYVPVKEAETG